MRLLVIAIEEMKDGRMFKVRRNVPWEAFNRMASAQQKDAFLATVRDLRDALEKEFTVAAKPPALPPAPAVDPRKNRGRK